MVKSDTTPEQDIPTTDAPEQDAPEQDAPAKPTAEQRQQTASDAADALRGAYAAALIAADDTTGTIPADASDALRVAYRAPGFPAALRAEVIAAASADALTAAMDAVPMDVATLAAVKHAGNLLRDITAEVAAKPTRSQAAPADPRADAAVTIAALRLAEHAILMGFTAEDADAIRDAATLRADATAVTADLSDRMARAAKGASGRRAASSNAGGASTGVGKAGGKGNPAKHVAEVVGGGDPSRVWTWAEVRAVESSQYGAGVASQGALRNAVEAGKVDGVVAAVTATGKRGCRAA